MKRRTHNKTKTGCLTCKRRRIKCDEAKPRCRNCHIHDASECLYPMAQEQQSVALSPSAMLTNRSYTLEHMELLHHFSVSTALTFSSHPRLRELWSVTVPRLGLSYSFVLHAILAVSSMHLSRERPTELRTRWTCGIELQQQAVTGARQAMTNISADNCAALYLFSALTCIFSLARGINDPVLDADASQKPGLSSFMEWMSLYRGTLHFLGPPYEDVLRDGPLGPMFEIGTERRERIHLDLPSPFDAAKVKPLTRFREAIQLHVEDTERLEVYNSTLEHLRRSFQAVYSQPIREVENMEVFIWVFSVSDEYVELLKQRDPISLGLFACFATLIRVLRHLWWTHGWGEWCIDLTTSELKNADPWILECVIDVTK